jgi:hypothetical protein
MERWEILRTVNYAHKCISLTDDFPASYTCKSTNTVNYTIVSFNLKIFGEMIYM